MSDLIDKIEEMHKNSEREELDNESLRYVKEEMKR